MARGWADEQGSHGLAVFVFQLRDEESARALRARLANGARALKGAQISPCRRWSGASPSRIWRTSKRAVNGGLFVRRARLYIVATQHVDLDADEGHVGSSPASKRTAKREEPAVGPGAAVDLASWREVLGRVRPNAPRG